MVMNDFEQSFYTKYYFFIFVISLKTIIEHFIVDFIITLEDKIKF